jgi:hypothetical protein
VIDGADFTSVEELTRWTLDLDRRGLRATGSPAHKEYIDDLARRMHALGLVDVHQEGQYMRRWTPHCWGLMVDGESVSTTSFVSYSGSTGPQGVTGKLSYQPVPGVIGVVEVPAIGFPMAMFDSLDWDAPTQPAHDIDFFPETPFERVWLSQDLMRAALARFEQGGAAGLVIVVDLPAEHITDGYLLYDGVHRQIPAVFVSREAAAGLREAESRGAEAVLTLEAGVEQVETHNVLGLIPGVSDELIVLQSHTDGTNGLEDNGPEAILAMAGYLAAQPREQLPRTVLVLLTTGHFAIEESWGVEHFLYSHADDLVPRIAAVLSLEHLGALPSRVDRDRGTDVPEHEFGAFFTSPHRAVIDSVRAAMIDAAVTDARVLRPFVPDVSGHSPDGMTWPGDGGPFWHTAGLPTANFITGPDYLLNVESVMEFIDVEAMRRQAIAFTEATLELSAVPWQQLHARMETAVEQPA